MDDNLLITQNIHNIFSRHINDDDVDISMNIDT